MSDHTPGPWELIGDAIMPDPRRHLPDTMLGIANIQDHGSDRPLAVHRANARLIASAPDLLEALELLNQSAPAASCEMFHHEKQDRHTFLEECPPLIRYEQACLKARAAIAKARGTPC